MSAKKLSIKSAMQALIDDGVASSLRLAQAQYKLTDDLMIKKAARALVRDCNEVLNTERATLSDLKRITRAAYRLFACVNGGL